VWRAELSGQPVVVKQLVPAGPEAAGRYAREVGALRLAGAARPPVAPRLLGSDPGERVLVLEYLKEDRPPGADAMTGWAEALARLHAAGVPGADDGLPRWPGPSAGDVEAFLTLARALGVPAAAPAELAGVVSRLAELPAQALLHGDPCPDNALHTADGVRFIDFEQAARGNGLVKRAERTGVDHWGRLLDQDWTWGTATARQRLLHRLLVVGQLAADGGRAGRLADTGRLAGEMAGAVLDRWPGLRPLPSRWRWWDGLDGG
jgi:Phosphotransferase enzyme family